MFPALRLKLIKGGSVLRVPFFWQLNNVLILLVLCLFSDLMWWIYILMILSLFSLLRQEEWFYSQGKQTLSYCRGLRGLSKVKYFQYEDLEGIYLRSVGRYQVLILKGGGREWEIERSLSETSLYLLQDKLVQHWHLKRLD